jgi:tRNA dimethylallyltransferase
VGRYLADLAGTLAELEARRVTPILTGGTGMYYKAALYGLSDIPAVPDEVRATVRAAALGRSPQELHAELAEKDPETAARLRPTDPQRILRALEVFTATGKPLAAFHGPRAAPLLDAGRCKGFFIAPSREALYARIDRRFEAMMEAGALEEVDALRARRLDPALPAMRAHGVPHLIRHLEGLMPLDAAIAAGQRDTRHYAKRQFTFARHQLPDFTWLSGADIWTALEAACVA